MISECYPFFLCCLCGGVDYLFCSSNLVLARHEGLPEGDVLTSKNVAANHM